MFPSRKFMIREAARSLVKQICGRSINEAPVAVQVGDSLPNCQLYEDFPTNIIQMPDFVMGKNVVIFSVLGAFSPGCSRTHLPGYVKAAPIMKKAGVDEIVCVSVNDTYVMGAWAEQHHTKKKIRMFADPTGTFIYSLGLGMNSVPFGGFRAMRFSMVVVDNILKELNVEPDGTGLSCSLAEALGYKMHLASKCDKS